MPALTMRGRYLMREYWTDSDLFLKLSAQEREVYVGLWMLADDEGWLPRDLEAIGAAIYRYEDREPRLRLVRDALERLANLGKVRSTRCCLYLETVSRYPRAGRKNDDHAQEHRKHSNRPIGIQRDLNPSPVPSLPNPSLPDVAGTRKPRGSAAPVTFKEKIAALGFDPDRLEGKP